MLVKFDKTELQKMVDDESDILKKIEDEVIGNTRWSIQHVCIFEYKGEHYKTFYSVGATEMQYPAIHIFNHEVEEPFEYCEKDVKCIKVVQKEVLMKQWIEVDE